MSETFPDDPYNLREFDSEESVIRYVDWVQTTKIEIEEEEAFRQERIGELTDILPAHLKSIGLIRGEIFTSDDIEVLVAENYTDFERVENLYLYVWGKALEKLGPFARASITDLLEYSEIKDPIELEKDMHDQALMILEDYGVGLGNENGPGMHMAIHRFSWLLQNEPALEGLGRWLKKGRQTGGKVDLITVAAASLDSLTNALEGLKNLDDSKMTSLELEHKKFELKRLNFTLALATAGYGDMNQNPV